MKNTVQFLFGLSLIGLVMFSNGCSMFGEKNDETNQEVLDELEKINNNPGTKKLAEFLNVAIWSQGFLKPSDVLYGYDKLIYVTDREANKIFQFDENGKKIGEYSTIKNPTKMAMDRKGNLFVIGDFDSLGYTLSTIFYIQLHESGQILKNSTPLGKKIIHPFYIPSFSGSLNLASQVKFVGIATYSDNSFIAARRGPDIDDRKIGGHDNTIVTFDNERIYRSNLASSLLPVGSGLKTINNPTALATYANPPQSNSITSSKDFLMGMEGGLNGVDNFYKVQGVVVTDNQGELIYDSDNKFLTQDADKANRFLFSFAKRNNQTQSRFIQPNDISVTNANNKQYIFVVDSQLDSVYQFTYAGFEGVASPNGAGEKNIIVSFGGRPNDGNYSAYQLKNPEGVAFGNNRLYVTDTGNRRVLVYKLSTDIVGQ